jgi:hypothetical protein
MESFIELLFAAYPRIVPCTTELSRIRGGINANNSLDIILASFLAATMFFFEISTCLMVDSSKVAT